MSEPIRSRENGRRGNEADRLIAIYSHGKSGTTSIFRSLESQTDRPLVRFHMLNASKVRAKVVRRERAGLKLGRSLRNSRRYSADLSLLTGAQLITMIRDPIASAVSAFFYRLARHDDDTLRECVESGDAAPLIARFTLDFETIERQYLRWFDDEIGAVLGLDIYDRSFDRSLGSQIYREESFDLLVAKLECDDHSLEDAIRRFLSLTAFRLARRNTAQEKPYNELYELFRRRLALSAGLVHRIYASRSVRHFYTEDEIHGFQQRWTRAGT
ncbi:MAG: putative capsular polysaccharide synthesis family protein [Thermoanaerobaculia bacterium]|nr:putative capsular polysaccharide synthesis family protein [Thermoanaerobaculia bacterium]